MFTSEPLVCFEELQNKMTEASTGPLWSSANSYVTSGTDPKLKAIAVYLSQYTVGREGLICLVYEV